MKSVETISSDTSLPKVGIFENSGGKPTERQFSAIGDNRINNPNKMLAGDRNEELTNAQNAIIGNEQLERLVIRADDRLV